MTDLETLRALYEKATQVGEWFAGHAPGPVTQEEYGPARLSAIREFSSGTRSRVYLPWQDADADLIVALHNAFPALASELEVARKVVADFGKLTDEMLRADDDRIWTDAFTDALNAKYAYERVMEEQR